MVNSSISIFIFFFTYFINPSIREIIPLHLTLSTKNLLSIEEQRAAIKLPAVSQMQSVVG